MKPLVVVLLAFVAAVAAWFGATLYLTPAKTAESDVSSKLDAVTRTLEDLNRRLAAQEKALSEAKPGIAQAAAPRVSDDELVERVAAKLGMKSTGAPALADASAAGGKTSGAASRSIDLNTEVGKLMSGLSYEKRDAIWKALREAGLLEQAVEAIESKAKADPGNAGLQVLLGSAYLQKLFTVSDGPEKGTWAIKADKAFDAALAIDDHNWSGRFSKSVSLSFWPPVFNKQPEAIKNFEVLVAQQEQSGQSKPEFAQTYFYLSNLYSTTGKADQALATVKKGLAIFPDDPQLKANLQQLESK